MNMVVSVSFLKASKMPARKDFKAKSSNCLSFLIKIYFFVSISQTTLTTSLWVLIWHFDIRLWRWLPSVLIETIYFPQDVCRLEQDKGVTAFCLKLFKSLISWCPINCSDSLLITKGVWPSSGVSCASFESCMSSSSNFIDSIGDGTGASCRLVTMTLKDEWFLRTTLSWLNLSNNTLQHASSASSLGVQTDNL
jgi:hypothetical protein